MSRIRLTGFMIMLCTYAVHSQSVFPRDPISTAQYQPATRSSLAYRTSALAFQRQLWRTRDQHTQAWLAPPGVRSFFCRNELRLEKRSALAPRFRLGSVNYTDWMEGKKEIYDRYRK